MSAIVIGGGMAAVAACYGLRRGGVTTTCLLGGPGATALSSGALDGGSSGQGFHTLRDFCFESGHELAEAGVMVATRLGVPRLARGTDGAVLNLLPLASLRVGIPRLPRAGWDADWLARSLSESHRCIGQNTKFVPFDIDVSIADHSGCISAVEYSALVQQLSGSLCEAMAKITREHHLGAWLLPPSCFFEARQAADWSARIGVPVGETLSGVSDVAGYRFERNRDRFFERLGVTAVREYAVGVTDDGSRVNVSTAAGEMSARMAVLATGGWIGGGLRLSTSNRVELAYKLDSKTGPILGLSGRPFSVSASWGVDIAALGLNALSQVGMLHLESPSPVRLVAAGDAAAARERTLGAAIESGLSAAEGLIRSLGASGTVPA